MKPERKPEQKNAHAREHERGTGGQSSSDRLGRDGAGVAGQNWAEHPDVARKGRYHRDNREQGETPERSVDTDISEAV